MEKLKLIIGILTLGMMICFVSGCSNQGSAGRNSEDGQVVLEMWTREASENNVRAAVEIFNEEDHGFQVKVTAFPNHNLSDQFASALSAGEGPDIISIDLILAPYFSSIGAFHDLTDYYNSIEYKDKFNKAMVRLGRYEDKQFALPFSADVSALFYNKDHFKEVGLDPEKPPETWQEMREYAKKLTTDDRYGYVYNGGDLGSYAFTFLPFIWGNGGDILNEDGTESLINSEEAIEALTFYRDLTLKDKVTPSGVVSYTGSQSNDAFGNGTASMILSGNFGLGSIASDYPDLNFGVALIPKNEGKEHSSFAGGELIAIPTVSKYKEEAQEFLEFALSEELQVEQFAKTGTIPIREDFFDNQYFQEEPRYQVFTEGLKVANAPYTTKYTEIFSEPLLNAMQSTLKGEIEPRAAFEQADKEIKQILNH
ncbi:ABC transporter substrate-binding protein [Lederbergia sp. NSJ-179]|uniref:ABC transporter substrate-binding protein n=1 Tax=Lederbergia sp. NSJ-179 TaxID=2931402 RepID=UPI001FD00D40|nr:ABC transporter substrate-binding protein [Lederbergia sp. NSJ-179]MCJ7842144.1 ABC transporter substrate-binding protein [Lederbergia sp. NSJ-179]